MVFWGCLVRAGKGLCYVMFIFVGCPFCLYGIYWSRATRQQNCGTSLGFDISTQFNICFMVKSWIRCYNPFHWRSLHVCWILLVLVYPQWGNSQKCGMTHFPIISSFDHSTFGCTRGFTRSDRQEIGPNFTWLSTGEKKRGQQFEHLLFLRWPNTIGMKNHHLTGSKSCWIEISR